MGEDGANTTGPLPRPKVGPGAGCRGQLRPANSQTRPHSPKPGSGLPEIKKLLPLQKPAKFVTFATPQIHPFSFFSLQPSFMALSTHSRTVAAAGLLALLALASCKKDNDDAVAPTAPPVAPAAITPLFFPRAVINSDTTFARGTLVSLRKDVFYLQANSEYLQSVRTEEVRANFYDTALTPFVDAGAVSVNGFDLPKGSDGGYSYAAGSGLTASPLAGTSITRWRIGGAGGFPAFDYVQNTPFPSYNGTPFQRESRPVGAAAGATTRQVVLTNKPTDTADNLIDTREELVLPLGSNVSAADSMHVYINSGSGPRTFVRTTLLPSAPLPNTTTDVAAPTQLAIPADKLAGLAPSTDGTAFLQIVTFRTVAIKQSNQGPRGRLGFAFVKAGVRMMPLKIKNQ